MLKTSPQSLQIRGVRISKVARHAWTQELTGYSGEVAKALSASRCPSFRFIITAYCLLLLSLPLLLPRIHFVLVALGKSVEGQPITVAQSGLNVLINGVNV